MEQPILWLFVAEAYYPSGGMRDFHSVVSSHEEATRTLMKKNVGGQCLWAGRAYTQAQLVEVVNGKPAQIWTAKNNVISGDLEWELAGNSL